MKETADKCTQSIPKQSQFVQKNEKLLYHVHKWLDDVEVEQVVLKM